jgi:precorrin-2 dehydrogenase / sirohydrochlorin ferrochelatase
MNFLPICLNIENAKIVVVGGGKAAEQKLKTLLLYTHNIVVCAPEIQRSIYALPVTLIEKPYEEAVMESARMVYACTDDRDINRKIAADAKRRHILVCVADDPECCDFISAAIYKKGSMSVAVSSNAQDVKRSVTWRDRIAEKFKSEPTSKK